MKYYIIAGEPSGDRYAAQLVEALRLKDAQASFIAWGGPCLAAVGVQPTRTLEQLAFMGFWEVLKNLRHVWMNFRQFKRELKTHEPDAVIFIDYPGFNLKAAKISHEQGFRNFYYISPQLWAWKKNRLALIEKFIEKMIVIFPFEVDYYAVHGVEVYYYGHPLAHEIEHYKKMNLPPSPPAHQLALLPGSRVQEVRKLLPVFIELAQRLPERQFVLAGMSKLQSLYEQYKLPANIIILYNEPYEALLASSYAFVCSGTACLETALVGTPEAIVYKSSALSFWLGKQLVKIPFIGMPNLIAGKQIIKEFIQEECTAEALHQHLLAFEADPTQQAMLKQEYEKLSDALRLDHTMERTAALLVDALKIPKNKSH